jgi:catechol 2,3-dioxygenase-like lactoylglutathione lyase family enzyme
MPVIDHLSVGVPVLQPAIGFYDGLFETIGVKRLATSDAFAAYGVDAPAFLLMPPYDGKAPSAGNGVHIAFGAPSKDAVDAFHQHAVNNGGACEGAPGPRDGYPMDVYTAYVRDPFGNKLEVIFNGFGA